MPSCTRIPNEQVKYCGLGPDAISAPKGCVCACSFVDFCSNPLSTQNCIECPIASIDLKSVQNCVKTGHSNNMTSPALDLNPIDHRSGGGAGNQPLLNLSKTRDGTVIQNLISNPNQRNILIFGGLAIGLGILVLAS